MRRKQKTNHKRRGKKYQRNGRMMEKNVIYYLNMRSINESAKIKLASRR